MKIKKFLICFFALALILSQSAVFATDAMLTTTTAEETTTQKAQTINEDKYIYNTDSYSLTDIIYGNVFASTTKFVTNPRIGGGTISGNLFLISEDTTIASDVTYSNNKDKNNNYMIDSINSNSVIYGNVYVLSNNFTLESGSEIHGDLYIVSNSVTIEPYAVIEGNVFMSASDVSLNGQIEGSVYITTDAINMNYFAYIERDLHLTATTANLDGVVYRNAFISAETLVTQSDFKVNQNLSVNYANNFTFSGRVNGEATINAANLSFENSNDSTCTIRGNLNYSVKNEVQMPDGVVNGNVIASEYVEQTEDSVSFSSIISGFFIMLVYVFGVVFLAKRFAPKAIEKLPTLTFSHTLISLGIGFVSFLLIVVLSIALCLSSIGITLSLFFVAAYLFLIALALPLFINKIADTLNFKMNSYLKLLIVTTILYLIKLIPVLGSSVFFIAFVVGIGEIIYELFAKNN